MNNTIKYIVFYDMTGKIYFTMSTDIVPSGLENFVFEVPENYSIIGMDLSDPQNPQVVTEKNGSQEDINEAITDIQEAIAELYEKILNMEDK